MTEIIKNFLPRKIRNLLWSFRNSISKNYNLNKWRKNDCPYPPPHQFKQLVIQQYQKKFNYHIFIETGTLDGDMIEAQRNIFLKLYSIELNKVFWQRAVVRFKKYNHIQILQGDSSIVLNKITNKLSEPAIFWLDGHYSAGDTAKGDKECPIFEEIDAIFSFNQFNHIIIIDDANSFDGKGDYPTIDELTLYIKKYNIKYELNINSGVLIYELATQ